MMVLRFLFFPNVDLSFSFNFQFNSYLVTAVLITYRNGFGRIDKNQYLSKKSTAILKNIIYCNQYVLTPENKNQLPACAKLLCQLAT